MDKFIDYLEKNLPTGYDYVVEDDSIGIFKGNEYVYVFFRQEIVDDCVDCCGLLDCILNLSEEP